MLRRAARASLLASLLLIAGCSGVSANRVRFGTGPAAIEVDDQDLLEDCEIVSAEAEHPRGGGIVAARVLLRCLQDEPLSLEYRVTWWGDDGRRLPAPRDWILLELPGRKETVVSIRPPTEQSHRARRGTFELRYHSPPE